MSENKPDLMAELAEVVRLAGKATPGPWVRTQLANVVAREWRDEQGLNQVIAGCPSDDWLCTAAVNFLRTHHAELEAVVRDAKAWRALCSDCDKGPQHDTPLSVITDALYLGSGALERHYMHNSAREG